MPKPANVDVVLYQKLWEIQQAFRQAEAALESFGAHPSFVRSEIRRFTGLWEETCAATASYLLGVLEQIENERAGRVASRRLRRQCEEE
jgi:hypothetical protein